MKVVLKKSPNIRNENTIIQTNSEKRTSSSIVAITIISLLFFMAPSAFEFMNPFSLFYPILNYGKLALTMLFVFSICRRGMIPVSLSLLILAFVSLFVSSLVGDLNVSMWINWTSKFVGMFACAYYLMGRNSKGFIWGIFIYFFSMLLINNILMIVHDGYLFIYRDEHTSGLSSYFAATKNNFSHYSLPLFTSAFLLYYSKVIKLQLLAFSVFLGLFPVFFAWSATSIVGLVFFLLAAILFRNKGRKFWIILLIGLFVFQVIFTFTYYFDFFQRVIQVLLVKDLTLSGRSMLWAGAHQSIADHFLLGRGNGTNGVYFYAIVEGYETGGYMWAHNTTLDILVQGGIIMLFIFVLFQVKCISPALKHSKTPQATIILAYVATYLIFGIAERQQFSADLYILCAIACRSNRLISDS